MKLIMKLNPKTTIACFHELERRLQMDFKDARTCTLKEARQNQTER